MYSTFPSISYLLFPLSLSCLNDASLSFPFLPFSFLFPRVLFLILSFCFPDLLFTCHYHSFLPYPCLPLVSLLTPFHFIFRLSLTAECFHSYTSTPPTLTEVCFFTPLSLHFTSHHFIPFYFTSLRLILLCFSSLCFT